MNRSVLVAVAIVYCVSTAAVAADPGPAGSGDSDPVPAADDPTAPPPAGDAARPAGDAARPAGDDRDPHYLSGAVGWFDVGGRDQGAEFRLEYRSDLHLWLIKPFLAAAATTTGSFLLGGGVLIDIDLAEHWVLTGSGGINYYDRGGARLDLGRAIQFRSQGEIAYRFADRSRLSLAFSHYSNLGLDEKNPGTETLSVYYSIPLP